MGSVGSVESVGKSTFPGMGELGAAYAGGSERVGGCRGPSQSLVTSTSTIFGCDVHRFCFLWPWVTRRPRWRIEVAETGFAGFKVEGYPVIKITLDLFRLLEVWASLVRETSKRRALASLQERTDASLKARRLLGRRMQCSRRWRVRQLLF